MNRLRRRTLSALKSSSLSSKLGSDEYTICTGSRPSPMNVRLQLGKSHLACQADTVDMSCGMLAHVWGALRASKKSVMSQPS